MSRDPDDAVRAHHRTQEAGAARHGHDDEAVSHPPRLHPQVLLGAGPGWGGAAHHGRQLHARRFREAPQAEEQRAQEFPADDPGGDRVARHTQNRGARHDAEGHRLPRHDLHSMRQQLSRLGDDHRREVVPTGRGAGVDADDVRVFRRPRQRPAQRLGAVLHDWPADHLRTPLLGQTGDQVGVGFRDRTRGSSARIVRLDQLVSGRDHGHTRPAVDRECGHSAGKQRRDLRGADLMTARQHHFGRGQVLPRDTHMLPWAGGRD